MHSWVRFKLHLINYQEHTVADFPWSHEKFSQSCCRISIFITFIIMHHLGLAKLLVMTELIVRPLPILVRHTRYKMTNRQTTIPDQTWELTLVSHGNNNNNKNNPQPNSPRRGCPSVMKFCMWPSVTKRIRLHPSNIF